MLSRDRLEELRQSANAAEVEIPPWAVAWTEAEARAFFETGGTKVPSLDVPPNESGAATQALTVACEKLSIVYRDEPVLKGKLTKGVLIGTGGTALVWLATHKESGQKLALKQLFKTNVAKFGTLGTQLAFREQEAYNAFASPFIVRCFGCFQDNLCLYQVLELCVCDLFQLGEEEGGRFGELPEVWSRFYTASVALALRHIHRTGFVYRDLKLENIMVAANGYAKLTDLGSAKRVDGEKRTYTAIGTEEYIPPEVLKGQGRNAASDWWGLGILAHELLMGRPPFDRSAEAEAGTRRDVVKGEILDDIRAYSRQGGGARELLRQRIVATGGAGLEDAADFVVSLLDEREPQRLGCGRAGFQSLQGHRWFRSFDWLQLLALEMPPPYVPRDIENRDIEAAPAELAHLSSLTPVDDELQAEFAEFGPRVAVDDDGSFDL